MPIATRGPEGRAEHGIETAELDADAAQMRSQGMTYQQIATVQGCDKSTASRRVQRALASVPAEAVEELRRLEESRLDAMWAVAWEMLHESHVLVQYGKVVEGEVDNAIKIQAVHALLRIQERRARLRGLDAPTRKIVEVITEDTVDAAIRQLEAELAEMAAE